jgi:hypothetical protein
MMVPCVSVSPRLRFWLPVDCRLDLMIAGLNALVMEMREGKVSAAMHHQADRLSGLMAGSRRERSEQGGEKQP